MSDLGSALDVAAAPKQTRTVIDVIASLKPELEKSLQSEAAAQTLTRHYMNAVRYNPLLMQCTAESLVAAMLLTAQLRLEPGPLGHVYLVPFRDGKTGAHNVVWMLGYTGIVELGRRGGAHGLRSTVVWDNDEYVQPWENEKGLHWTLKPGGVSEQRERVGALIVWKENGERQALHMPPERVDVAIRASRNPKARELRGEDWYWRKTGVRFARPWLPLSPEFAYGARADGAAVPRLDVDVDGTAQPALENGDDE